MTPVAPYAYYPQQHPAYVAMPADYPQPQHPAYAVHYPQKAQPLEIPAQRPAFVAAPAMRPAQQGWGYGLSGMRYAAQTAGTWVASNYGYLWGTGKAAVYAPEISGFVARRVMGNGMWTYFAREAFRAEITPMICQAGGYLGTGGAALAVQVGTTAAIWGAQKAYQAYRGTPKDVEENEAHSLAGRDFEVIADIDIPSSRNGAQAA